MYSFTSALLRASPRFTALHRAGGLELVAWPRSRAESSRTCVDLPSGGLCDGEQSPHVMPLKKSRVPGGPSLAIGDDDADEATLGRVGRNGNVDRPTRGLDLED